MGIALGLTPSRRLSTGATHCHRGSLRKTVGCRRHSRHRTVVERDQLERRGHRATRDASRPYRPWRLHPAARRSVSLAVLETEATIGPDRIDGRAMQGLGAETILLTPESIIARLLPQIRVQSRAVRRRHRCRSVMIDEIRFGYGRLAARAVRGYETSTCGSVHIQTTTMFCRG